jgi:hypothetical protein
MSAPVAYDHAADGAIVTPTAAWGFTPDVAGTVHWLEGQRLLYPAGRLFALLSAEDGKVSVPGTAHGCGRAACPLTTRVPATADRLHLNGCQHTRSAGSVAVGQQAIRGSGRAAVPGRAAARGRVQCGSGEAGARVGAGRPHTQQRGGGPDLQVCWPIAQAQRQPATAGQRDESACLMCPHAGHAVGTPSCCWWPAGSRTGW